MRVERLTMAESMRKTIMKVQSVTQSCLVFGEIWQCGNWHTGHLVFSG
jgi:hypothetical protein